MLDAVGAKRIYIYAMGLEPWLEYLLGLAYTQDAPQIREATRLLAEARSKGFEEARLLSGCYDIHLPVRSPRAFETMESRISAAVEATGAERVIAEVEEEEGDLPQAPDCAFPDHAEDKFSFE
jgi:hypothetical protein